MRILLFGLIAEKAGTSMLMSEATSLTTLRQDMETRIPGLGMLSYAIAVDRRIVKEDMAFTGQEEVALLPPFAGG